MVTLLHVAARLFAVLIRQDSVNGGLWPIALAVSELLAWKHHRLLWNQAEGDTGVVRSSELVLIARVDGAALERHFVELFEVTWVLCRLLGALVQLPFSGD